MKKGVFCIGLLLLFCLNGFAQDFDSKLQTANNLLNEEKYEEALSAYRKILETEEADSTQLSWANGYAGMCLENLEKNSEAIPYYKLAIEYGFPNYSIYDKLRAIAKKQKDYELQRFVLEKKLAMFPEVENATLTSLCYVYANLRDYNTLLNVTAKLIETGAANYKTHYFRALAFQQTKKIDDAIASYKEALALKPDDYGSNMNLGLILYNYTSAKFEHQNKKYEAIAKPTRSDYTNYTKTTEALKKEYLEAEPYLTKAFETKKTATLNKALYNLFTRTQQKQKIESYGLSKE